MDTNNNINLFLFIILILLEIELLHGVEHYYVVFVYVKLIVHFQYYLKSFITICLNLYTYMCVAHICIQFIYSVVDNVKGRLMVAELGIGVFLDGSETLTLMIILCKCCSISRRELNNLNFFYLSNFRYWCGVEGVLMHLNVVAQ